MKSLSSQVWGQVTTAAGPQDVQLITFASEQLSVSISTFGALLQSVKFRRNEADFVETQLGYDTLAEYLADSSYLGTTVGRYANRIANGAFRLDGEVFDKLAKNDSGRHSLHGGVSAFHRVLWTYEPIQTEDEVGVALTRLSPDGEEGFPADLSLRIEYVIPFRSRPATLRLRTVVSIPPTSPKNATVCSIANHCYWNLSLGGAAASPASALGHLLRIEADHYTPVDAESIPTGEILATAGTRFDFRELRPIFDDLSSLGPTQIAGEKAYKTQHDYDHNFVLRRSEPNTLIDAATLQNDERTVQLKIATTLPGLQLYTTCYLPEGRGHGGRAWGPRAAVCLEPQFFPNTPNVSHFPTCIVRKAQPPIVHVSEFTFSSV